MEKHAITPAVAARAGVVEREGSLVFTVTAEDGHAFERVRPLAPGPAKVFQPKGEPLAKWWPLGQPMYAPTVLLTEGASDTLAALSALATTPVRRLAGFDVAALPGTGFPIERVVPSLRAMECRFAYTAFDGDEAGAKLTRRLSLALDLAGIRSAALPVSSGHDLGEMLTALTLASRGVLRGDADEGRGRRPAHDGGGRGMSARER